MSSATTFALALHRSISQPQRLNIPAEANERGRATSAKNRRERAEAAYRDLEPLLVELREEGLSLRAIANVLNASGHNTRGGQPFGPSLVCRILARIGQ